MITTITVKYSCDLCALDTVTVEVPAREDEDVNVWMRQTVRAVCEDHQRRSPVCHPETLTNLMIPVTGTKVIGGPSIQ